MEGSGKGERPYQHIETAVFLMQANSIRPGSSKEADTHLSNWSHLAAHQLPVDAFSALLGSLNVASFRNPPIYQYQSNVRGLRVPRSRSQLGLLLPCSKPQALPHDAFNQKWRSLAMWREAVASIMLWPVNIWIE